MRYPTYLWTPRGTIEHSPILSMRNKNSHNLNIDRFCAAVVHPDTGETITKYNTLVNDKNDDKLRETWRTAMGKEARNSTQGDKKTKTLGKIACS